MLKFFFLRWGKFLTEYVQMHRGGIVTSSLRWPIERSAGLVFRVLITQDVSSKLTI